MSLEIEVDLSTFVGLVFPIARSALLLTRRQGSVLALFNKSTPFRQGPLGSNLIAFLRALVWRSLPPEGPTAPTGKNPAGTG